MYRLLILLIPFLWSQGLSAQRLDLNQDPDLLDRQTQAYQRWLNHSGLGQILQIKQIDARQDSLNLNLGFSKEDTEYAVNAWNSLKQAFEAQSSISLERQLFQKMIHYFEVPRTTSAVQIVDLYDPLETPKFYRIIYFEAGRLQIEASNPKSKVDTVSIKLSELRQDNQSRQSVGKGFSQQEVFNSILKYARDRYRRSNCTQRYPAVKILENGEILQFRVSDLCKEVIEDASNPIIAQWLTYMGLERNWIKRELLDFTITYTPEASGFQLKIEIDGKVGPGLFQSVKRGAYHSIEVDFEEYLQDYTNIFAQELKSYLVGQ